MGIVPSAAYRAQILAAQPSLAPFINAYPTSTTVSATDPNQALYTSVVPSPSHENSGVIRIDHRLRARDSMYSRYNIDDGLATSSLNNSGEAITVGSRVQNFVLEELHTFSPTLLNEAEFGFNRNTYVQNQTTGLPYNFSIAGFTSLAETYNKTQVPTTFSVNDTLTIIRGQHTIKAGIDIRRVHIDEANSADGTLSFTAQPGLSAEQAVLANHLNSIQVTAPLNDRGLRKTQYAGYAQDQWKFTPNLTLNYGLRYSYFSPFNEAHNNEDPFDFASCGGYCGIGAQFYFRNLRDFDPRLAVAWSRGRPRPCTATLCFARTSAFITGRFSSETRTARWSTPTPRPRLRPRQPTIFRIPPRLRRSPQPAWLRRLDLSPGTIQTLIRRNTRPRSSRRWGAEPS